MYIHFQRAPRSLFKAAREAAPFGRNRLERKQNKKKEVPPVRAGLESGLYRMFHGMSCVLQYAITGCPRYQSAPTIEFWKDT